MPPSLAAAPAGAGVILVPERPNSVMEPLAPAAAFDLEVTQNRRLGPLTTVRLLDLRSTGSRDLTSATVFWGDGTTSGIALSPDVTYAHLTFPQHRYPVVWERRQYDIAVQVADSGGAVR